jgi:hypothetical protein
VGLGSSWTFFEGSFLMSSIFYFLDFPSLTACFRVFSNTSIPRNGPSLCGMNISSVRIGLCLEVFLKSVLEAYNLKKSSNPKKSLHKGKRE